MARTLLMAALVLTLGVAAPAQAGKVDFVPIKGTLAGTETVYPAAGTWELMGYFFGPEMEFDIDGDAETDYTCSEPAHELVVGTLTGNVSHLGKVTREMWYCAFWEGPEQYRVFDFTQVLIAANGGRLILDYGLFSGDLDFAVETPIAGGTGRYVDASGTLYEIGRLTLEWWPPGFGIDAEGNEPWVREVSLRYTRDSHITYDASSRAAK